jgi:hypothetical protein
MNLDPKGSDRYLYVVGPDGYVYYSPQSPQSAGSNEIVKHTTLAGKDPNNPDNARPMRVGGEILYDRSTGTWVMDGASGRYSTDGRNITRTPENVQAAAALANASGGTQVTPSPDVFPPRG